MRTPTSRRRTKPPTAAQTQLADVISRNDFATALRALEAAVRKSPADTTLRLQLARLREADGDRAGAAIDLTRALRYAPSNAEAAERLGAILAAGLLPATTILDPGGLASALAHMTVDRDLLGAAALHQLKRGTLGATLAHASRIGMEAAASHVVSRRASEVLRDPLLVAVLQHAIVLDADVERLLAALRKAILLEVPLSRFAERDMASFAAALLVQMRTKEYLFPESEAESRQLAKPALDAEAALAGDPEQGAAFFKHALYRSPVDLFRGFDSELDVTKLSPPAFAAEVAAAFAEDREIRRNAEAMPRLSQIAGETSVKVRAQYEANPYPRWRSVALYQRNGFREHLVSFFDPARLSFLDAPFDLLVAGCGTGCQAVSAALDYGANARVLGLDLSGASLGYAAMMARRMGAANATFAQGDILEIPYLDPSWKGRFKVIECSGVLHHMAEPFKAWRLLLDCLAPGGIMLVGLYSATARRDLVALRSEPGYPGPDCSDADLGKWRAELLCRPADAPGMPYLKARDTFTTSGFRDYFLHVSEQTTTLPQIEAFLAETGLTFRGFVNAPFGFIERRFPGETWPGRLQSWDALEAVRPDLFAGMYQFWVTRD